VRFAVLVLVAAAARAGEPVAVDLVADAPGVAAGGAVRVGVRFRLEPHWHVYWRNAGDSGAPPSVQWTLPPGVAASALGWPAPRRIPTPPFMTFGYEGEVVLSAEISVPAGYAATSLPVAADVEWLVCDANGCIPGDARLSLEIPVVSPAPPRDKDLTRGFPRPGGAFTALARGDEVVLRAGDSLAGAAFFPDEAEVLDHAAEQRAAADGLVLRVAKTRGKPVARLTGVLVRGDAAWIVDVPVTAAEDTRLPPLAWAAALALVAGAVVLAIRRRRARAA
jgi:thiol:disulfide interchange protein DsbD